MPSPRFALLGSVTVHTANGPIHISGLRERKILAVLLLDINRLVSVSYLVDTLWEDDPPRTATVQVRNCVGRLRQVLGPLGPEVAIDTTAGGYLLRADRQSVDAHLFESLCRSARALIASGEAATASGQLRRALALWRGDALQDVRTPYLAGAVAHLEEVRADAVEQYADIMLAHGESDRLIQDALRWLRGHPYHERLHVRVAQALHATGRPAEALRLLHNLRTRLLHDLGVDVGAEVRATQRSLTASTQRDDTGSDPVRRATDLLGGAVAAVEAALALLTSVDAAAGARTSVVGSPLALPVRRVVQPRMSSSGLA